jgi:hypothetical protein
MRCQICGGDVFTSTEYRTDSVRAPARECAGCRALVLDEDAATSQEERHSVRMAVAARAACSADEHLPGQLRDEEPVTLPAAGGRTLGAVVPPR